MPNFISNGKKPQIVHNEIWSNDGQPLFGIAPLANNAGPHTSIQSMVVTDDSDKPNSMTIYLIINTQFKQVLTNQSVPVKLINKEIKLCRSFDLEPIHNHTNYSSLHNQASKFLDEMMKHAQFEIFKVLASMDALPLHILESLIFNPDHINLNIKEQLVELSPFIHYYQLLNLPRINLVKDFSESLNVNSEMGFTCKALKTYLADKPNSDVLNQAKQLENDFFNLNDSKFQKFHKDVEDTLESVLKSVTYDLTMNENNRTSTEYLLFRDYAHRNCLNNAIKTNVLHDADYVAQKLDDTTYAEMNFQSTFKTLDAMHSEFKQHIYDNLSSFQDLLGHTKDTLFNCCHFYTSYYS